MTKDCPTTCKSSPIPAACDGLLQPSADPNGNVCTYAAFETGAITGGQYAIGAMCQSINYYPMVGLWEWYGNTTNQCYCAMSPNCLAQTLPLAGTCNVTTPAAQDTQTATIPCSGAACNNANPFSATCLNGTWMYQGSPLDETGVAVGSAPSPCGVPCPAQSLCTAQGSGQICGSFPTENNGITWTVATDQADYCVKAQCNAGTWSNIGEVACPSACYPVYLQYLYQNPCPPTLPDACGDEPDGCGNKGQICGDGLTPAVVQSICQGYGYTTGYVAQGQGFSNGPYGNDFTPVTPVPQSSGGNFTYTTNCHTVAWNKGASSCHSWAKIACLPACQ